SPSAKSSLILLTSCFSLLCQQLAYPPFPELVRRVAYVEFTSPLVPDTALFVDKHKAGPKPNPVKIPGLVVVVLSVGVANVVPFERPRQVALIVLARIGRELRRVNANDREALVPVL